MSISTGWSSINAKSLEMFRSKGNELLAFPANSRNLSRIGEDEESCICTHTRPSDFRNFRPKILKLIDLTRNVGADIVSGVFGSREVGNIRVIFGPTLY